jgi:hypothetical protein
MKVKNLRQHGKGDTYQLKNTLTGEVYPHENIHSGGWEWEEFWDEFGEEHSASFKTDKDGCGLWKSGKQILGTCQYSAAKTYSGQRRKILRDSEDC